MAYTSAAVSDLKGGISSWQRRQIRSFAARLLKGFQSDDEAFEQAVDECLSSGLPSDNILARAEERISRPQWKMFRDDFWQQVSTVKQEDQLRSLWLFPVCAPLLSDLSLIKRTLGSGLKSIAGDGNVRLCPLPFRVPRSLSPEKVRAAAVGASTEKMPKGWLAARPDEKRAIWAVSVKFEISDCLNDEAHARRMMRALLMTQQFGEVGAPGIPVDIIDRGSDAWRGLADITSFPEQMLEFLSHATASAALPVRIKVTTRGIGVVTLEIYDGGERKLESMEINLASVPVTIARLVEILKSGEKGDVEVCASHMPDWLCRSDYQTTPSRAPWIPRVIQNHNSAPQSTDAPIAPFDQETVTPLKGSPFLSREIQPRQPRRPVYR